MDALCCQTFGNKIHARQRRISFAGQIDRCRKIPGNIHAEKWLQIRDLPILQRSLARGHIGAPRQQKIGARAQTLPVAFLNLDRKCPVRAMFELGKELQRPAVDTPIGADLARGRTRQSADACRNANRPFGEFPARKLPVTRHRDFEIALRPFRVSAKRQIAGKRFRRPRKVAQRGRPVDCKGAAAQTAIRGKVHRRPVQARAFDGDVVLFQRAREPELRIAPNQSCKGRIATGNIKRAIERRRRPAVLHIERGVGRHAAAKICSCQRRKRRKRANVKRRGAPCAIRKRCMSAQSGQRMRKLEIHRQGRRIECDVRAQCDWRAIEEIVRQARPLHICDLGGNLRGAAMAFDIGLHGLGRAAFRFQLRDQEMCIDIGPCETAAQMTIQRK